jgi:hypothetical protein
MEDWEAKRKRFEALWENEIIDRCCISVTVQKNRSWQPDPFPDDPEERKLYWLDGERYLQRELRRINNTIFAGEAFPQIFANFGAAGHAAFFKGVKIEFADTVWMHPANGANPDEILEIEFDPDSIMLQKSYEVIKYLVTESGGRFFVSLPDISGNLDALAHIRGNDTFLLDMAWQKENIQIALEKIMHVWKKVITETYQMTKVNNQGGSTIGWLDTWAPGLHSQLQSDISVMISPAMYQAYVLPELRDQCTFLEYPLYHLDGKEQLRHLDLLLGLENLKMIQWTNVAGQPSPVNFIEEFQKIQSHGKGLLIRLNTAKEVEPLLIELSSKGLYLNLESPLESIEEAITLIKMVTKLTHD